MEHRSGHPLPLNAATLDHVLSRLETRSLREYRSPKNQVLSCWKCNHERGTLTESLLGQNPQRNEPLPLLLKVAITDDVFADFTQ